MRRLVAILLLLAAASGIGYAVWTHRGTDSGPAPRRGGQPVPVLVAKAEARDVPIWLSGLGTVQAFNSVTVRSMIDGPLIEVRFREGQDVKTGDVLARIDARPYQAALDQAVAKKAQDEANLANARLDLQRYTKLAETNYTTRQQADTQKAVVAQLEAQVRQDQAQIDTARTNLSYTTITAPLDGRTGMRQVDQGNIIHTSDTNGLVTITQLQPISVVFTLPQQALPAVRAAMQAGPVEVDAVPQGQIMGGAPPGSLASAAPRVVASAGDPPGDPPADPPPAGAAHVLDRGTLAVLDNQVDPSTGTIRMKATFPNKDMTLWPGGFVNVRLLARTDRNVTTVPPAAVQLGPSGAYVYVVENDQAKRRNVTLGHEDEKVAVIAQGLLPGETVVTDGGSRLTDGAHVSIASPPGSSAPPPAAADRVTAPGTKSNWHRRAS